MIIKGVIIMEKYTKGFCILVLIFSLNTITLAAIPSTKPYFNGPYLAVGAGMSLTTPEISSSNKTVIWTDNSKTSKLVEFSGNRDHGKYSKYNFNLPILAGYGKTFGKYFFLGGGNRI